MHSVLSPHNNDIVHVTITHDLPAMESETQCSEYASISLSQSSSAVGEMALASYNTVPFITVASLQHTASSQPQRAGHSSIPSGTFYQPTLDTGETKQHDVIIMRCDWSVVYLQRCSCHTFTS